MGADVRVALLVTAVLADEVEVVTAHDDGALHLAGRDAEALDDAATDGHVAGERALFVDVGALGEEEEEKEEEEERERRGAGGGWYWLARW